MTQIPGMPSGNSIAQQRREFDAKRKKGNDNYAAWLGTQGALIRANRPLPVFNACVLMALEVKGDRSPLKLKAEEIAMCEQRALSSARNLKHGPVRSEAQWRTQIDQIREDWKASPPKPATQKEAA